ncbi:MAG: hypothetical protein H7323_07810 [Frankiales bacterium]|nr:hypothetical protein [Frankiales bacterium]
MPLLPSARRASRLIALGTAVTGPVIPKLVPGAAGVRVQQGLVLGALALGMPHGASDTELLVRAARGSRPRHIALLTAYATLAAGSTAVVRRGGPWVERTVLVMSAAHFAEGELACWRTRPRRTALLRAVAAATTTVLLPAAVGHANRRPAEVGANAALEVTKAIRGVGEHSGMTLLRRGSRTVAIPAVLAAAAAVALAAAKDGEAAGDTALLLGLDLLAPPSSAFAAYFGGWHALRHTARVVDALVAEGQLPAQSSLPSAILTLGRRSAWAAGVGLAGAAALALKDPEHASDNAFAAVLGLTVPHMTTVAAELSRR